MSDAFSLQVYKPGRSWLIGHVSDAFKRTISLETALPDSVLGMRGMSGKKYRMFINHLVGTVGDRYLEVGSFTGSTVCAALWGNSAAATCIDDFSGWGPLKKQAGNRTRNRFRRATADLDVALIDSDFRHVDYRTLNSHRVYLYDGPHEYQDHKDALILAAPALADEFVLIIDDWNWKDVRRGTEDGLEEAGMTVLHRIDIRTTDDGSHARLSGWQSDWHNGYLIATVRRGEADARNPDQRHDDDGADHPDQALPSQPAPQRGDSRQAGGADPESRVQRAADARPSERDHQGAHAVEGGDPPGDEGPPLRLQRRRRRDDQARPPRR